MLIERSVWAVRVVVLDELLQHRCEVARPGDLQFVETLAAQRPDPALRDGIRPRGTVALAECWLGRLG
jgi:hypothetical protein